MIGGLPQLSLTCLCNLKLFIHWPLLECVQWGCVIVCDNEWPWILQLLLLSNSPWLPACHMGASCLVNCILLLLCAIYCRLSSCSQSSLGNTHQLYCTIKCSQIPNPHVSYDYILSLRCEYSSTAVWNAWSVLWSIAHGRCLAPCPVVMVMGICLSWFADDEVSNFCLLTFTSELTHHITLYKLHPIGNWCENSSLERCLDYRTHSMCMLYIHTLCQCFL